MKAEDLFNAPSKAGRPSIHPFAKMNVDEIVEVKANTKRMQIYAHVYGSTCGKKFATRTHDGVLYVKRIS